MVFLFNFVEDTKRNNETFEQVPNEDCDLASSVGYLLKHNSLARAMFTDYSKPGPILYKTFGRTIHYL